MALPHYKIWVATTPSYTVTVYGKNSVSGLSIVLQYSLDGGTNWSDIGSYYDSTTCANRGGFQVVSGNSASVRAFDGSSTYYMSRTLNSTTCPGSPYTTCNVLISNVTSNRDVAITVDVGTAC